jgi:high-affinity iron transporter
LTGCRGIDSDLPPAYRNVNVPEVRLSSPAAREHGRVLFQQNCALCHGERGDGHGPRAPTLSPRPQDFTDPDWHWRTTPRRAFFVIREGVRGTPMASWKALREDDTWDLVAYVLSLA